MNSRDLLSHLLDPQRERLSPLVRPLPRLRLTPRLTPGCTTLDSMEVTMAMLPTTTPPSLTPMLPTPTDTPMLTTVFPMLTTAKGLLIPGYPWDPFWNPMQPKTSPLKRPLPSLLRRERPSLLLRPPLMLKLTLRPTPGCTTPESGEDTTAMLPTTTPPSPTPMLPTPTDTPMLTTACPMLTTAKGLLMPTNLGHPMHPKRERPSLSLRPPPMLRLTPRLTPEA